MLRGQETCAYSVATGTQQCGNPRSTAWRPGHNSGIDGPSWAKPVILLYFGTYCPPFSRPNGAAQCLSTPEFSAFGVLS